ncbi:MAG: serine/threonine-protein kinase [Aeromicrobium sp.]|uniref:serine/threonine-protein kinase n=1 Tax=Aeromicrobium sp. TaxID=1871063 RepID=UPI00261071C1|nr:serine/threonine-protein kinase [Aeromicrobium sp.]MDF1706004.1 serine/threonine-protein kinase [Aeromicrobium sp.]
MKVLRLLGPAPSTAGRHRAPSRRRSSGDERAAGQVLSGRYELVAPLGSGGMGTVHRAHDRLLDRPVAVKILRSSVPDAPQQRRRLAAEATIGASLRHPGIAQVYEHAEFRSGLEPTPYLVMELVEGVTLASVLEERGRLGADETLALVREVATTLDHLARRGVVHRDLKPANLMLTPDERVVLVDLGIALAPSSTAMTTTGAMLGTADFISPEQILGRSATPASDLYALGLVAHLCVSGAPVFRRETTIASAYAHVHEPVTPLPDSVPQALRDLVTALCAKDPADRPASAGSVASLVERVAPTARLPRTASLDASPTVRSFPAAA